MLYITTKNTKAYIYIYQWGRNSTPISPQPGHVEAPLHSCNSKGNSDNNQCALLNDLICCLLSLKPEKYCTKLSQASVVGDWPECLPSKHKASPNIEISSSLARKLVGSVVNLGLQNATYFPAIHRYILTFPR